MKIAQICPYDMFGHTGGVPQVVMHLAKGLSANGHTVKIITPRPPKFKDDAPDGYIFLGNSRKISMGLATAGDIGYEIDGKEIDEVLEREKFDVINYHEPWIPHLSSQIVQRANCAQVGTFHANLVDSIAGKSLVNLLTPYGRGIIEKMDLYTAVSSVSAQVVLNKQANHPLVNNIKYIPNGIDLKRYRESPVTAIRHHKLKTILYVGRLEGRKGVKHLLDAYQVLTQDHEDVQLFIAGNGPDANKLRNYVKDNHIPRVTFLGFISDEDKIHYMHRADLFCSPAHKGESFGIVLLEAMAAGCPIVAGDNIGYASVMKGTGAISLVNPLDRIDFTRRLDLMLYDENLRKLWRKWADKYVEEYDWDPIVDMYEDAYKEAIKLHEKKHHHPIKN